jgi:endonuclease/exonuclease/phosphatase family metal-dependent hydrolase
MAIDERVTHRIQDFVSMGFLVIALIGGSYLIEDGTLPEDPEFIKVGWWNIRDLSSASRNDAEIRQIAIVISELQVLAVGELNDPDALRRITEELGPEWDWAATEEKIGRTKNSKEYYGFLWNTESVEMTDSIRVDPDPGDRFDREPAWATFRTVTGTLDFTVICVHITWWKKGVTPRKEEVKALAGVWDRTQNETPEDDDLILMGDFNRNKNCSSFQPLLSISGMLRANEDTGPTHISSKTTYDQIFLSTDETREWTGEWETINYDEIYFDNDDAEARLAVSDHRPVWIRLVIPLEDDD